MPVWPNRVQGICVDREAENRRAGNRPQGRPTEERKVAGLRVPGGWLFWILLSVVLSVGLTVLVNLVLLLF